eukprot:3503754-Prymnesium_polylepis.1
MSSDAPTPHSCLLCPRYLVVAVLVHNAQVDHQLDGLLHAEQLLDVLADRRHRRLELSADHGARAVLVDAHEDHLHLSERRRLGLEHRPELGLLSLRKQGERDCEIRSCEVSLVAAETACCMGAGACAHGEPFLSPV